MMGPRAEDSDFLASCPVTSNPCPQWPSPSPVCVLTCMGPPSEATFHATARLFFSISHSHTYRQGLVPDQKPQNYLKQLVLV